MQWESREGIVRRWVGHMCTISGRRERMRLVSALVRPVRDVVWQSMHPCKFGHFWRPKVRLGVEGLVDVEVLLILYMRWLIVVLQVDRRVTVRHALILWCGTHDIGRQSVRFNFGHHLWTDRRNVQSLAGLFNGTDDSVG